MKKRSRRCDLQKQKHWEEVMRRWQEGGQSVRAYCQAEGLRESAFYFWRRELARRGYRGDAPNGVRPQPRSAALSFLPVRVVEPRLTEAARGVEIVLPQGRTVRVQAGFDRQTLAEVLAVLEVRPC